LYTLVAKSGLENTDVTVSGTTPGGEYKVGKQTFSPHSLMAVRVPAPATPQSGQKYYGDSQYSAQRGYYGHGRTHYDPQPTYPNSVRPSGLHNYNEPQEYKFGMRWGDW